jgi:hypothetical protein
MTKIEVKRNSTGIIMANWYDGDGQHITDGSDNSKPKSKNVQFHPIATGCGDQAL